MKLVTKKFVSLFAAMTMLFSVCGVFANAASNADSIDAGYVLVFDEAASNVNQAVVKVQLKNIAGPFSGMNFTLPVDTEYVDVEKLTDASYVFDANVKNANGGASYSEGTGIKMNCASGAGFALANADGTVVTITLPLKKAITSSMTLTLSAGKITPAEGNKYQIGAETTETVVGITAPTVDVPRDPSTPPSTVDRPGEEELPVGPTPIEPQPDTGYNLVLDKANTDLTSKVTVKVQLKNIAGPFSGMNFTLPVDTDVIDVEKLTDTSYEFDANVKNANGGASYSEGTGIKMNCASGAGFALANADGTVVTITLPLKKAITSYIDMTLSAGKITPAEGNKYQIGAETTETVVGITAPILRVDPEDFGTKPVVKKTAALKDYTDKDAATAAKAAEDAGKTTYMTVDVKKDGVAATYGSDFIAKYDGKEIKTVEEYKNIIHGYVADKKVSDVIAKMTFEFYTDGKFAISTTVNAAEDEIQLVPPVEDKEVGGGNEPEPPKPSEPKFKANFNPSRPDVGDTVVVTAEISDATDVTITFDEAAFKADTDSANLVSYLGIYPKKDVDNSTEDDTKYLENTWEFKAMAAGELTVPFKVSYTKVSDGTKVTDEVQKATVKISEVDNNNGGNGGSGSGDKDNGNNSGGGAIAPPANGGVNGGLFTSFSDLDQAEWAKQAIMVLSVKGIVSGYGDGTFNPNGNITRAEYCQILIGAIGKTNLAADVLFNDVPSEAWYYHAVSVANSLGIVSGYGDGNFGPNDLITRQDMALMTYKAAQVMNKDVSSVRTMSFADAGSIAEYAATAVQTLADAGIINGVSDTEFAPVANATRAQAAKILYDTFVKVN